MCISVVKKNQDSTDKPYMFFLQWHITSKCDQRCKHCYMFDSPFYESESKNELPTDKCIDIIDDFTKTTREWGVKSCIVFGGGDPLLRNDFYELLGYSRTQGVDMIAVMGNSYHVNDESALKMKNEGVFLYQISLDGMKKTHDMFRKPGSFDDALRGYKALQKAGIQATCMFTLSKINKNDIIDVIRLAADLELAAFDFDRIVTMGAGKNLSNELLEPDEYKELLYRIDEEYESLRKNGAKTIFGYKDNLWCLVKKEIPQLADKLLPEGYEMKKGCIIGKSGFAVLADGNVMACRRLPVIIGKFPEQSLSEVCASARLKEMKNFNEIKACGSCHKLEKCGGCRAVAYGYSEDYYAKDPQCWA